MKGPNVGGRGYTSQAAAVEGREGFFIIVNNLTSIYQRTGIYYIICTVRVSGASTRTHIHTHTQTHDRHKALWPYPTLGPATAHRVLVFQVLGRQTLQLSATAIAVVKCLQSPGHWSAPHWRQRRRNRVWPVAPGNPGRPLGKGVLGVGQAVLQRLGDLGEQRQLRPLSLDHLLKVVRLLLGNHYR